MNKEMPKDPIQRAAAVTADYEALQGVTAVAIGIGLIVTGVAADPLIGLLLIAVSAAIGQGYYFKKYGRVRRTGGRLWIEIAAVLLLATLVIIAILVDHYLPLPILLAPLGAAGGLWYFFRVMYHHVGTTRVHTGVIAVLAVSTFLPLTGLLDGISFRRVDLVLIGLAFIVVGIVDHLRLTAAMKPVADE